MPLRVTRLGELSWVSSTDNTPYEYKTDLRRRLDSLRIRLHRCSDYHHPFRLRSIPQEPRTSFGRCHWCQEHSFFRCFLWNCSYGSRIQLFDCIYDLVRHLCRHFLAWYPRLLLQPQVESVHG